MSKQKAVFAFASLVLVLLTGLAGQVLAEEHSSARRRAVRSMLEMRQERVVIQQWDITCGAAALATILNYQHGEQLSERTIVETMLQRTDPLRVKYRGGFSLLDLKRFAERRGYTADGYMDVDIEHLVEFGPSIVPVNLYGYNHFVVFRGRVGDRVLIADPAFGNRTLSMGKFEDAWLENLAFVVRRSDGAAPPGRLAPQPEDFIRPREAILRAAVRSGG